MKQWLKTRKKIESFQRDKEKEEVFVKAFVFRNRRERSLDELSKIREAFLDRLCHRWEDIFDSKYLYQIPKTYSDADKIFSLLCKEGAGKTGYVISINETVDAKVLPLKDALRECVGFGAPSIILCVPGKLAYFEAEQDYGPPPRFILKR